MRHISNIEKNRYIYEEFVYGFTDVHWVFLNHYELIYHEINQQINNKIYENFLHHYYAR